MPQELFCPFKKVFFLSFLIFVLWSYKEVGGVKIEKLDVPTSVRVNASDIILDCMYRLEKGENEEPVVVKWYFGEDRQLVYQKIENHKANAIGILKDRLDLDYEQASDDEKVHSTIKIIRIGFDLSGNYSCLVSTFQSEDIQIKEMKILD